MTEIELTEEAENIYNIGLLKGDRINNLAPSTLNVRSLYTGKVVRVVETYTIINGHYFGDKFVTKNGEFVYR